MATILIIEDEDILANNIRDSLDMCGHDLAVAQSGEEGLALCDDREFDIILLDYRLPNMDGLEVLNRLKHARCPAAIIMITAHGDIKTAVAAMKSGATNFLKKPIDLDEINLMVEKVIAEQRVSASLGYFRDRERTASAISNIVGSSTQLAEVTSWIQRITTSKALCATPPPSVLITGETGTGKDLAARAIHYGGPRHEGQFVHVNCTSIPAELFESELFGHVRGAFTDAKGERRGLFEVADGGTVFLDEIGHMSMELQAKLLSVLDTSMIRPVGSALQRKVNVHVIAATNRLLLEAIDEGDFRQDLYHRLRVLSYHLPPLRDRGRDVVDLAAHFLDEITARLGVQPKTMTRAAERKLLEYDWPGNVRELLHVVESTVLLCDANAIEPEHLNLPSSTRPRLQINLPTSNKTLTFDMRPGGTTLEDLEYQVLQEALVYSKQNLTKAAQVLGVSRDVIRYRCAKHENRDAPPER